MEQMGSSHIDFSFENYVTNPTFIYDLKSIVLSTKYRHDYHHRRQALDTIITLSRRFAPAQMVLLSTLAVLERRLEEDPFISKEEINQLTDETKELLRKSSDDVLVIHHFKNCIRFRRYTPKSALKLLTRLRHGTQRREITDYSIPEKAIFKTAEFYGKQFLFPSEIEVYFDKTLNTEEELPRPSSRAIYKRDGWICQYCGKSVDRETASIDHVYPRSRGGGWTWLNCVTSCKACNNKKGNRTPEEAGMPLRNLPFVPNFEEIY